MLAWIIENKEWLFSGVAVAVLGGIGRWLYIKWRGKGGRDGPDGPTFTHSGSGDQNVAQGDRAIGKQENHYDNSIHQMNSGGGDNVAGNKIVNQLLPKSAEYKRLVQELKDAEELLAGIAEDKIKLRLKQAARVKELRKRLEAFKEDVFRLHEIFTRIPIDNERLRRAKAHFDKGEFREADAVLKAGEIQQDVERLKLEEKAAADRLAAVREGLEGRANEFLLKARLSLLNPLAEGEDRLGRTEHWFEQALATARTAEVLFEYANFLWKQNAFSRAEPLYQEALQLLRSKAEADPKVFRPQVAATLNNLAALHWETKDFAPALAEFKEALKLYRDLAAKEPDAFQHYVAGTLNNLGLLHYETKDFAPALAEYEEALKIRRELAEKEPDAFLPDVADTLNNLAGLHAQAEVYDSALVEFEEALTIRRGLAEKELGAFNQVLATTLLNLSIFYLQDVPDKDKSVAYAQEAREILQSLIKQAPHLQSELDKVDLVLERNKAKPAP